MRKSGKTYPYIKAQPEGTHEVLLIEVNFTSNLPYEEGVNKVLEAINSIDGLKFNEDRHLDTWFEEEKHD